METTNEYTKTTGGITYGVCAICFLKDGIKVKAAFTFPASKFGLNCMFCDKHHAEVDDNRGVLNRWYKKYIEGN